MGLEIICAVNQNLSFVFYVCMNVGTTNALEQFIPLKVLLQGCRVIWLWLLTLMVVRIITKWPRTTIHYRYAH